MLDLIVEPAESEVRKPAASDVARHEDLPAQKSIFSLAGTIGMPVWFGA
jgi:hypothetical protein